MTVSPGDSIVFFSTEKGLRRIYWVLELRLQTSKELTHWILSWMPHVRILALRQLQDQIHQRLREGLAGGDALHAADEVGRRLGEFSRREKERREEQIGVFLRGAFPKLFGAKKKAGDGEGTEKRPKFRLGFDVAASGQGDLAAIYVDEAKGDELWLRALLTCRTEDWHFLKTTLFHFLEKLPGVQAAGMSRAWAGRSAGKRRITIPGVLLRSTSRRKSMTGDFRS